MIKKEFFSDVLKVPSPLRGRGKGRGGNGEMHIQLAKNLRKRSTDAEKLLWKYLRAKRLLGLKFKRQQPMGMYIIDFVCFEKKLVIELDGGQHAINLEMDKMRDFWLEEQGFRVLHIWNSDVFSNIQGVLQTIMADCSGKQED
jgi:very-short-patch-repair endonuclease